MNARVSTQYKWTQKTKIWAKYRSTLGFKPPIQYTGVMERKLSKSTKGKWATDMETMRDKGLYMLFILSLLMVPASRLYTGAAAIAADSRQTKQRRSSVHTNASSFMAESSESGPLLTHVAHEGGDPVPEKHAVEDVRLLERILPPNVGVGNAKEEGHVHVQCYSRKVDRGVSEVANEGSVEKDGELVGESEGFLALALLGPDLLGRERARDLGDLPSLLGRVPLDEGHNTARIGERSQYNSSDKGRSHFPREKDLTSSTIFSTSSAPPKSLLRERERVCVCVRPRTAQRGSVVGGRTEKETYEFVISMRKSAGLVWLGHLWPKYLSKYPTASFAGPK